VEAVEVTSDLVDEMGVAVAVAVERRKSLLNNT